MSDNELITKLQDERAEKVSEIDDAKVQRIAAQEAHAVAEAEYRAHREAKRGWGASDEQGSKLERAEYAARNIVEGLNRKIERAELRIKELDRLLTAADDAGAEEAAMKKCDQAIADTRAEIARFRQVASAYESETQELTARRASVIAEHAKLDLNARLAGKASPRLKSTNEIDADLESRAAALSATRVAIDELNEKLQSFVEERAEIQRRFTRALSRRAELSYYAALQRFFRTSLFSWRTKAISAGLSPACSSSACPLRWFARLPRDYAQSLPRTSFKRAARQHERAGHQAAARLRAF